MALKAVVTDLTQVPEPLRGEYESRDGAFHLKLEGDIPGYVPAAKLSEFRDNNTRIMKALGADSVDVALQRAAVVAGIDPARLAELKEIDPAEYKSLKAKLAELEKKGVKGADDLDARFKAMLDSAVKPIQDKLDASEKKGAEAQARADEALLRETIGTQFVKAGGQATALDFIVAEFKRDFYVADNAVKPRELKYNIKGEPLKAEEWLADATKKCAFAFGPSTGGGAIGGGGGNGGGSAKILRLAKDEPIRFPAGPAGEEMRKQIASGSLVVDRTGT